MATRVETYALALVAPYMLERGIAQTITAPIRHGATGALVAPTQLHSNVSVTRPDGTALASEAAVSVPSSTAQYELTPSASEVLGAGWTVVWSLVINGERYTYRQSAYLCEYVPRCTVSVLDLYRRVPELQGRVPAAQGDRGTGEGWQPQIDEGFGLMIQKILDNGHEPWRIREITGSREWLLTRILQLCVGAIGYGPDSTFAQRAKELAFDMKRAEAEWKIQYADDTPTLRRGGTPSFRLAPVRGVA